MQRKGQIMILKRNDTTLNNVNIYHLDSLRSLPPSTNTYAYASVFVPVAISVLCNTIYQLLNFLSEKVLTSHNGVSCLFHEYIHHIQNVTQFSNLHFEVLPILWRCCYDESCEKNMAYSNQSV